MYWALYNRQSFYEFFKCQWVAVPTTIPNTLQRVRTQSSKGVFVSQNTDSNRYWQLGDATRLQISIPAYAETILSKNCPQIIALKEVVSVQLWSIPVPVTSAISSHLHILWRTSFLYTCSPLCNFSNSTWYVHVLLSSVHCQQSLEWTTGQHYWTHSDYHEIPHSVQSRS